MKNQEVENYYNKIIQERYGKIYEFNRWFLSSRLRADYFMNYSSIMFHLANLDKFSRCLEFGPGPGTWTKVLYAFQSNAQYDLVDISQEMKQQFMLEMRESKNVKYLVEDITKYRSETKYDFFFSSRAFEYLDSKDEFLKNLHNLLDVNAKGIIITKNKDFGLRKRKHARALHQGQLNKAECKKLLSKYGFKNIEVYSATIRVPLLDRINTSISEMIYKKVYDKPMNGKIQDLLTESFLIKFQK